MSGFVEVLPPELTGPAHSEWFEARKAGVTASEIAVILGLSPYDSAFALYHRKRGDIGEQADTDAMRWGRRLEAAVADEFAERHADTFRVLLAGLYAHPDRAWQMASPDRLIYEGDYEPVSVLECKTAGSFDDWGPDGTDDVPAHIRAQVLWQLDTLGLEVGYVAVLVAGRSYREYEVKYDEEDAAYMRVRAEAFLQAIHEEQPPDVDGSPATIATLRAIHPDLDDAEQVVPLELAERYRAACRALRKAEDRKRQAEAALRDRMGRARYAVTRDGQRVAFRSRYDVAAATVPRAAFTVDKLQIARERTSP